MARKTLTILLGAVKGSSTEPNLKVAMSISGDRQELLRNAIAFLNDSKTQSSSLAKRIEFLESKGLTPAEIEEAIKQASESTKSSQTLFSIQDPPPHYIPSYAPSSYTVVPQPPPVPSLDWRDYFIMAVVSGGVMYGVMSLARKYLFPHLKPPNVTAYEADRDALNAQFDAAEALLKELHEETKAVREASENQQTRIEQATTEVEAAVKEMRENETRTRDEMREIRQEIDTIQDMLPKMLEKNKEAQAQSLAELQQELKSLKTLLLNRGPSVTPPPFTTGKPSIPAWQLASTSEDSSTFLRPGASTNGDKSESPETSMSSTSREDFSLSVA